MIKRVSSVLVLIALCVFILPVNAFAASKDDEFTVDGSRYMIIDTENHTVSFQKPVNGQTSSYSGDITVPATVESQGVTYSVTEIQSDAFANATGLTKVTLPDSVTTIPESAFAGCNSLTSVTFGNAVTKIGASAFAGCAALTTLTIPDTVTVIGKSAFAGLGATSLVIPSGVVEGDAGLIGYEHLDGVTFKSGSPFQLSKGVLYCGTELVMALDRTITSCDVLDGTTSIKDRAFANGQVSGACTNLTTVTLPSSLETIGLAAFGKNGTYDVACTALKSVTFRGEGASSLRTIGEKAFAGCTSLESMVFPDSLTSIGQNAFQETKLTSVVIPAGVTSLPTGAFSKVSLQTVVLPDSVTSVGQNAFSGWKSGASGYVLVVGSKTGTNFNPSAFGMLTANTSATPTGLTVLVPTSAVDVYTGSVLESFVRSSNAYGLTMSDSTIKVDGTATFTADVPTGCTLTVESAASDVATAVVGTDGKTITVTGAAAGEAKITAKITLDSVNYTLVEETVTVTVVAADKEPAVAATVTETPKAGSNVDTNSGTGKSVSEALTANNEGKTGITVTDETGDVLTNAAKEKVQANTVSAEDGKAALEAAKITVGEDATVSIVIQTYLEVTIEAVSAETGTNATLTLDVTPKYKTIATTADPNTGTFTDTNSVEIPGQSGTLNVTEATTVSIPLPDGFFGDAKTIYVKHIKEDGTTYIYSGTIEGNVLTFYNPHGFSTIILGADAPAAKIGEVGYTSLADALDDVKNNGEVQVVGTNSETIYVDGTRTFTIKGDYKGQVVATNIYTTVKKTVVGDTITYTCVYTAPSVPVYRIAVNDAEGGKIKASANKAAEGATIVLTPIADDEEGELETLAVVDEDGNAVTLTKRANGSYSFVMPAKAVTVTGTFTVVADPEEPDEDEEPGDEEEEATVFTDVDEDAYYAEAVAWAVANEITKGTSETTFSPDDDCTRAQVVTFLWRYAGKPEPTTAENPFTDVEEDTDYYKAILWAYENGITTGTSETTFSPDDTCTRAQVVTFLWRYEGELTYEEAETFTDVAEDAYYAKAVAWAVHEWITKGTGDGQFSPDDTCTRGQVVTFLYRDTAEG
jgi:hypothetical protein